MRIPVLLLALSIAVKIGGCASGHAVKPAAVEAKQWTGSPENLDETRYQPVVGLKGMVVADDRQAAEWGAQILREGGNAIDAAVATAFAMAVTRPHYAALGGGGFMIYCPKPAKGKPSNCVALDYREMAPKAATRDMYIRDGKAVAALSQDGALASGVPGVPGGLLFALSRYGSMERQRLLSLPIRLARDGIRMSQRTEGAAYDRWDAMSAEAKRIFGCGKPAKPCPVGTVVKQPDLGRVLEAISEKGALGFYDGWVAQKIADGLKASGGIMTVEDLKTYAPRVRVPVTGRFKGMEIVSMPPPSAGGTLVVQMLGYVERAEREGALAHGYGSAQATHAISHAMALAFADRAELFGDPDHVQVPAAALLSPGYMDTRWGTFKKDKANLPEKAGEPLGKREHMNTTHFSVIDGEGNAVAITTTVNDNFGSGFVPPGTGVVMNNEMDDFASAPGTPNLFGLVQGESNAIAPGKRPLSSMSPTIVRDSKGNARIVTGAAGGPRITTSVFLTLVNRLQFGMSLPEAVAASRFHHQWRPVELRLERQGFAAEVRSRLEDIGYALKDADVLARGHSLERFESGRVWGVPDPRGEGAAVAE